MSDLIDQGAPEFFVDGWDNREVKEGIFSASAFRIINGQKFVVLRILQRVTGLQNDIAEAQAVLAQGDVSHGLVMAPTTRLAS